MKTIVAIVLFASLFNSKSFAQDPSDYIEDMKQMSVMANQLAKKIDKLTDKTSISECEMRSGRPYSGKGTEVQVDISECNTAKPGSYADAAKQCAEAKVLEICRIKRFDDCERAHITTTFSHRYLNGSYCKAKSVLTVNR